MRSRDHSFKHWFAPREGWNQLTQKVAHCVSAAVVLLSIGSSSGLGQWHAQMPEGPRSCLAHSINFEQDPADKPSPTRSKQSQESPERMRKTIRRLTTENEQLRTRVAELERRLQASSVRDRLTKEEQRAESLQNELVGISEKLASLQSRAEELNEQLRSDNIDRQIVGGSLRPEEVREATRRRLNGDLLRIQAQIELLTQNRTRIQSSLAVTDMLIQTLRTQLQGSIHP